MPTSATPSTPSRRFAAGLAALLFGLAAWPWAGGPDAVSKAAPVASTSLVINEVDYRQPGADDAEFVEIMNVGNETLDLSAYDLALVDVNGEIYWREALAESPTPLPVGAYYVLCDDAGLVPNCDRGIKDWMLRDAADSQSVANVVTIIQRGALRADFLIDSVAYDGPVPGEFNGRPWMETSPVSPADDETPFLGISRFPDGNDSDVGDRDFQRRCISPGRANTADMPPCQDPATATPTATDTPRATPTPEQPGPNTLVLVVDDAGNEPDARPGDGACGAAAKCTLRAALMEANASQHSGPILIRFAGPMEIRVPADDPLPPLTRSELALTGVNPGPGRALTAAATGQDPAAQADSMPAQAPVIWLHGPGPASGVVGLNLNDTSEVHIHGLLISHFEVGIWIHGGGSGNVVGVVPDGIDDAQEGNVIAANGQAQVRIGDSSGNVVGGNRIGTDIGGRSMTLAGIELHDGAASNLIGVRAGRTGRRGAPNQIQWRHRFGVWLQGGGTGDNHISGNLIGAAVPEEAPEVGNVIGIMVSGGAQANTIGGFGDDDDLGVNAISFNLTDGIQVDALSIDNVVRGNMIHGNGQNGIRLARTARGGSWLTANAITNNGGAAIAFNGNGYEPPWPLVDKVTALTRDTWQVEGRACAGCAVELFSDPSDEARLFQGATNADGLGLWQMTVRALADGDTSVAATARGPDGASSRLSPPVAPETAGLWRLHAVPPPNPRALRGAEIDRRYRLYDERRQPVPGAEVRFTPGGWRFPTDAAGFVDVRIPVDAAAAFLGRGMAFTVQAVARGDGLVHPVLWRPAMAVALEQAQTTSPEVILDLSSLTPGGVGALLRRSEASPPVPPGAWGLRLVDWLRPASRAPATLAREDAVGAAWTAAAEIGLREGDFAWQENIARGGALYELKPGSAALEGELEIRAPIAAWNAGGPASACEPPGQGAVMCGWNKDTGCWVPIAGSAASAPGSGAETVAVRAQVAVPPAGGSLLAALTSTATYTLYTVGFDVTPPVITPTLANGAVLGALPPVLAQAVDEHAGVDAINGVQVLLNGQTVVVEYDRTAREIRVPEANRPLAPGPGGAADLAIHVTDGFCNRAERVLNVVLEPGTAPTATATGSPTAVTTGTATATAVGGTPTLPRGLLYLPSCWQRRAP